MEDVRFDRLVRGIADGATRRSMLALLLGGFVIPALPGATIDARQRRARHAVQSEKKRKKKCASGLTTCVLKLGRKRKKIFCKDTQTDPFNCGGCGQTCATGQVCQDGTCTCNGMLCTGCCDGTICRSGNANHVCGANGTVCQVCTGGSSCQNGVCTCPTGQTYCAGACVDTKTDAANCGACGVKCSSTETCGGGNPGTPGVCGCTKTTCEAEGKNCGDIADGCGGELDCGATCPNDETCGGGGEPNVCSCLPEGTPCERMSQCCDELFCCRGLAGFNECRDSCG